MENITPKDPTEIEKPMEEPTEASGFSESTEPAQDIKLATIEKPIIEIEEIIESAELVKPPENNETGKPVIENEEPVVPVKNWMTIEKVNKYIEKLIEDKVIDREPEPDKLTLDDERRT